MMTPLYLFVALYTLWVLYLAVMNLVRARRAGTLTRTAFALGSPLLVIAVLLDVTLNIFLFTLLLFELPHEWTVSQRLSRHLHDSEGWRLKVAVWFGINMLNTFDPSGTHLH